MSKKLIQAAAGAGGAGEYVEDVFSTYLYDGNSSTQTITNNIKFGGVPSDGVYVHLDGESLTNKAPSNISLTNNNVSTYAGEFKFGTKSLNFDASNPSYLYLSEAAIDSSDSFCVETWVYFSGTTGTSTAMQMIAAQYINSQPGRLLFGGQSGNVVVRVNGGTVYLSGAVSADTWHHVAWTYDGTTHRLFVDGTLEDTSTTMPSIYTGINTQIGGTDNSYLIGYDLTGFLDEFRLTKGKARYTSSFSVPTAAFPTDTEDDSGEGGAVWLKSRNVSSSHVLVDTERGASNAHFPDLTNEQQTIYPYISSFNNNGFTLGNMSATNASSNNYTSWSFRKQAGFFDVVTYTGNGTAGRTVSHNLGSVPGCIIVKRTDSANGWAVYHRAMDATAPEDWMMRLNATDARFDLTPSRWNDTAPTSTDFTLSDNDEVNGSGATYVAYLFAHDDQSFGDNSDESIIKCGIYTGNGSTNGPEINLGWEPQWILVKRATGGTANWFIFDSMRGIATGSNDALMRVNLSDAEASFDYASLLATGFKVKTSDQALNATVGTYIYIAIRRPMKTPESGTEVFAIDTRSADDPAFDSGFPVDMALYKSTSGSDTGIGSRLTSGYQLATNLTSAEGAYSRYVFDYMDGWFLGGLGADSARYSWMFKRATGFFDVVTYTGTGATGQVESHNLGAVPEMIIVKNRGSSWQWVVYHKDLGEYDSGSWVTSSNLILNSDSAETNNYVFSQHSDQTNTTFKLGYSNSAIAYASGNNYIAYLFATLAGVSKVGSFTHTNGSDTNVDCGFTSGARFVLIKRTDNTDGWQVYDTARGIVAGADPVLQLNSTAAEFSQDLMDPYSAGFTITGTKTSGTYIFLAIA